MKLLEDRIHTDGQVLGQDILKVDRFLTHQVDYQLMKEIGKRFAQVYAYAAESLNVPMIFAKKAKNVTMNDDLLITEVYSFTKKLTSTVQISSKLIEEGDKVLIIDDFLANGQAALGLVHLMEQAKAEVVGLGMVIEKSFQDGRQKLLDQGMKLTSLARIEKFEDGKVIFAPADDKDFD